MKTLRTLLTFMLLIAASSMMAQLRLEHIDRACVYADPVKAVPGQECELVVRLNDNVTTETYRAWRFTLYLPEGIEVAKKNNSKYSYELPEGLYQEYDEEETPKLLSEPSLNEDGSLLFTYLGMNGSGYFYGYPLKSTNGVLIRIKLSVSSDFSGGTGQLKNVNFSNENNDSFYYPDAKIAFDGSNNGGGDDNGGDNNGGDNNGGNIPTPKTDGVKALSVDPVTIAAGGTSEIVVNIDYDTNETVVGYNFSLYLPEGITLNTTEPFESGKLKLSEIKKCITLSEKVYPVVYSDYEKENEVDPRYFLTVMVKNDGGKLVIWIDDVNKTPLKTTHGELLRLSVKAASDFVSGNGLINDIALTSDKYESLDLNNIADVEFGINADDPVLTDNYIYMDNTEVKSGAEETLSFKMKNEAAIRGFQFNLYLPNGVTAVKSAKGKIQASLNSGRLPEEDEHTLAVTEQEDGSLLFLCGSQADETFTGNDGEILTLKVKVADGLADGNYDVVMKNIKLSETDISKYYVTNEKKATLTVSSYMLGDINGDQKVDVSDYIGVANRILGSTPAGFIEKAGDVDENGVIDVSDYIGVANLILTGNVYGTAASRAMKANTDLSATDNVLYVEPFNAEAGTQVQMSLKMKNSAQIRGFQFNLILPEGVTVARSAKGKLLAQLSEGRLPAEDEHTLAAQAQADGSVLFLCGSQYDECFTGNDGEIATVTLNIADGMADGNYAVLLKNIKLTETDISKYYETAEVETTLTIGTEPGPDPEIGKNGEKWGDVNNDGNVDVADIATIITIMASQARLQQLMDEAK